MSAIAQLGRFHGMAEVRRAPGNAHLDQVPPPVIGAAGPMSDARLKEIGTRLHAIGEHWRLAAYTLEDGRQVLSDRNRQVVVYVEQGEFLAIVQHCIRYAHDLYAEVVRLRGAEALTPSPSPGTRRGEEDGAPQTRVDGVGGEDQIDQVEMVDGGTEMPPLLDEPAEPGPTKAPGKMRGRRKA